MSVLRISFLTVLLGLPLLLGLTLMGGGSSVTAEEVTAPTACEIISCVSH